MQLVETNYRHLSVFKIDNEAEETTRINIDTEDFRQYSNKLIRQFFDANNKRNFLFRRESTEVAQLVQKLADNHSNSDLEALFRKESKNIAERLLAAQKKTIQAYPNTKKPKEGSLVIILSKNKNKLDFLISKIDQANFIDLIESVYRTGLPDDDATQKTCSISYLINNEELEFVEMLVSDTNSTISKFWSREFLELKEARSDLNNTDTAYVMIKKVLNRGTKKSKADYTEYSNRLNGYFSTNTSYNHDRMIEYVIGSSEPISQDVNLDKIKSNLENLPSIQDFDTSFDLDIKNVKKKFKHTYRISDKIELKTTDYIEDLKDQILSKENEQGEKVLKIRNISDKVFEAFKQGD